MIIPSKSFNHFLGIKSKLYSISSIKKLTSASLSRLTCSYSVPCPPGYPLNAQHSLHLFFKVLYNFSLKKYLRYIFFCSILTCPFCYECCFLELISHGATKMISETANWMCHSVKKILIQLNLSFFFFYVLFPVPGPPLFRLGHCSHSSIPAFSSQITSLIYSWF